AKKVLLESGSVSRGLFTGRGATEAVRTVANRDGQQFLGLEFGERWLSAYYVRWFFDIVDFR
ncbi:hypothetical protein, partial [Altererythrobacter sp. CC-YST694]|uniref:hypothetical protein n=1 Tax=Altererythrobacter sp. CC-YST694 TaxID=2755038 RepID=UPI001D016199